MSEHTHEWHSTGYTMPEYACECGVSERDATMNRIAALEVENERLQTESVQKSAWISQMLGEQARDAAENARMREIVAAVASLDRMEVEDGTCPFCGLVDWEYRDAPHAANCPVTKARALLASDGTPRVGEE